MKPTNKMIHYHLGGGSQPGGGSVVGLQIMVDDEGLEFVQFGGEWTHVDEVPLPRLHRADIETGVPKPKRVPTVGQVPQAPPLPAFAPTTLEQRQPATKIHPDSPVLKPKEA